MKDVYPYIICDEEVLKLNGKPVVDVVKLTLDQWIESFRTVRWIRTSKLTYL